jgi:hypothetical protein
MPRIHYRDHAFTAPSLALIETCNAIIADYATQGFNLTLRQLYYQCVSRNIFPNDDREYRKLASVISDARLAGLIDWNAIIDRTRNVRTQPHWVSPQSVIHAALQSFALDKWVGQSRAVEVWIEKDALVGVIEGVCAELDVPFFSCRGYTSQSEMWAAGQRLLAYQSRRMEPLILHLGDHDPSGIDMTRDISERLTMFFGDAIDVRRIALTMEQIEQYTPPPNPAKITDSRSDSYIAEYGDESWELDALEPSVLSALIREHVENVRDDDRWHARVERQEQQRAMVRRVYERWEDVQMFFGMDVVPMNDDELDDDEGDDA